MIASAPPASLTAWSSGGNQRAGQHGVAFAAAGGGADDAAPQAAVVAPIGIAGVGAGGKRQAGQPENGPCGTRGSGPSRRETAAEGVDCQHGATGQSDGRQVQEPFGHDAADQQEDVRCGRQGEEEKNQVKEDTLIGAVRKDREDRRSHTDCQRCHLGRLPAEQRDGRVRVIRGEPGRPYEQRDVLSDDLEGGELRGPEIGAGQRIVAERDQADGDAREQLAAQPEVGGKR